MISSRSLSPRLYGVAQILTAAALLALGGCQLLYPKAADRNEVVVRKTGRLVAVKVFDPSGASHDAAALEERNAASGEADLRPLLVEGENPSRIVSTERLPIGSVVEVTGLSNVARPVLQSSDTHGLVPVNRSGKPPSTGEFEPVIILRESPRTLSR